MVRKRINDASTATLQRRPSSSPSPRGRRNYLSYLLTLEEEMKMTASEWVFLSLRQKHAYASALVRARRGVKWRGVESEQSER
jgi:hypothetical protein